MAGQNGCVRKDEFLLKLSNRIAAPSTAYLESLTEYRWTTEGWHFEQHTTYDYNAFGRTASWRHTWNGAEIIPERAFKTDFDENRQVELRVEVYDHPSWIPVRRGVGECPYLQRAGERRERLHLPA